MMDTFPSSSDADGRQSTTAAQDLMHEDHASFDEVLDFEMHVDISRLRELAAGGIPSVFRSRCYPLLLGVTSGDKTAEMTTVKHQRDTFAALCLPAYSSHEPTIGKKNAPYQLGQRLRVFLSNSGASLPPMLLQRLRFLSMQRLEEASSAAAYDDDAMGASGGDSVRRETLVVEAVLATHAAGMLVQVASAPPSVRVGGQRAPPELPALLLMAVVLAEVLDTASDAYYCTEALHSHLRAPPLPWSNDVALRDATSEFLMLLHHTNPNLRRHLFNEGIANLKWVPAMISGLFALQLPLHNVCDLWDVYFATQDFGLHPYVCLAVLAHFNEQLLELRGDALFEFLTGELPPLRNVAGIVRDAIKLREEGRRLV